MPNDKDWHDWYDVLRIPASASADEIKSAFRKAAIDEHADTSNHPDAHARAILVNKAGDILRDPKAKKQFDRKRAERERQPQFDVIRIIELDQEIQDERQLRTQAERRAEQAERRAEQAERRAEEAESQIARLEQTCLQLMARLTESSPEEAERRAFRRKPFRGKRFGESLPQKPHKYDFARYSSEDDERCNRNTIFHCDVCPKSSYHAYPSLFEWSPFGEQAYPTYKCNMGGLGHCRACFDLQREFYEGYLG